jgi:hypothetical protein
MFLYVLLPTFQTDESLPAVSYIPVLQENVVFFSLKICKGKGKDIPVTGHGGP